MRAAALHQTLHLRIASHADSLVTAHACESEVSPPIAEMSPNPIVLAHHIHYEAVWGRHKTLRFYAA